MRTLFLTISGLFVLSLLNAQQDSVIYQVKIYKTINNQQLKAHIFYRPSPDSQSINPAIAFFHGGGWAYGDPSEFFGACKRFARKGFVTISFEYRLCITGDGKIPHPRITPVECVKDARSAIRWMRQNATELRIAPSRIVVSGQSAGGQLALSTFLCNDLNDQSDNLNISPEPNLLLLYSSNLNMVEPWADYLMDDRRNEIWSISPYHRLKAGMPPAVEFHGTADCQVPFYITEFFKEETTSLGNIFEQHVFTGKGHYLGVGNEKYATYFDEEIMKITDEFLQKNGFMP